MDSLAIPLTAEQVDAAVRLHGRVAQWQVEDAALNALRERFPDFDAASTLLKVAAVNALFATNVYAVIRMAAHARQTIGGVDLEHAGPELVEAVAALPPAIGTNNTRRHTSFASKFAHFFVDGERFPIYDKYAAAIVRLHLGRAAVGDPVHPYAAFVTNFQRLRNLSGWTGSGRSLDRYLWLAGIYRAWRRDPSKVNVEAARLFTDPPAGAVADLRLLEL